jgi:transcriptional regulator with XRE-family HTH domain
LQKNQRTTYQVAKATGISSVTFTDWKKGRYTPKVDKLLKIAQYFGVTVEYFLDEGGEVK